MPYKFIELNFRGEVSREIEELAKKIRVELHSGEEFNIASIEELKKNLERIRKARHAIIKTSLQKAAIRACREVNVAVAYDIPDIAFARKLKEEDSYYFLSLKKLINSQTSNERIKEIKRIKEVLKVVRKYDVRVIASLEPTSIFELRSARQLHELLKVFGMSDSEAKKACHENAKEFLEIAEKKAKGRLIRKGLEVI